MALNVPTYLVEVSFTDPFDTPDWVDITRFVRGGTTKRGRQHELQRAIAGTCSLTVSNQDGRFSTFNTASPYVNVMTAADSYFQDVTIGTTTPGSWGNTTNCTLTTVSNQGYDGYSAMSLTSSSAATMSASTATGTSGYAVTAGNVYGFQAQFEAQFVAGARSCAVGVGWYNSGGTIIGSVTYGTSVSDINGLYTKATLTATAPAGATFAALFAKVISPANAEVHYVTRCMISNADSFGNVSTAWAPGGRGLVPARPIKVLATWSATQYPVFYGYIDSWLPSYGVALSNQVINASDGLTLLALAYVTSSAYAHQLVSDGAVGLWMMSDAVGAQTAADSSSLNTSGHFAGYVNGSSDPLVITSQGGFLVAPIFGQTGILFSDTSTAAAFPGQSLMQGGSIYQTSGGITLEVVLESSTLNLATATTDPPGCFTTSAVTVGFRADPAATGFIQWQHISSSTTGAISVNDGKPHHVAFTYDASGNWAGYIDGVKDASGSDSAPGSHLVAVEAAGFSGAGGVPPNSLATITYAGLAITLSALSAGTIATHASLALHGFAQQQSGQRIAAVLNILGIPSSLQTIATGISAVQSPSASLTTTPALSYIQTVENTEQGLFYIDEAGQYTYRDRHYILQNAAAVTSNGTFANDANNTHVKFQPGLVPANDALDLWNEWPVSAIANASLGVTGAVQNAPNVDSIRWYGKRTKTGYSSMLQTTDTEALSLSEWGVAHYSLPLPRVRTMKLDSTATNPSSLPQMLGRKLLDRITVQWQPIDGTASAFNQDSLIENIQHDFTPAAWTTTWGLSVAETQVYFTLDDASRGTLAASGALTGNRLGF